VEVYRETPRIFCDKSEPHLTARLQRDRFLLGGVHVKLTGTIGTDHECDGVPLSRFEHE
jgi:hypothetical protein